MEKMFSGLSKYPFGFRSWVLLGMEYLAVFLDILLGIACITTQIMKKLCNLFIIISKKRKSRLKMAPLPLRKGDYKIMTACLMH